MWEGEVGWSAKIGRLDTPFVAKLVSTGWIAKAELPRLPKLERCGPLEYSSVVLNGWVTSQEFQSL